MTRNELIEIVELSGATLLYDYVQYERLIIFCNSKQEMIQGKKQNDKHSLNENKTNVYYCKPEYLFDSIIRHEIQSIDNYLW